ncbi:hypothetical protein [Maribacter antarcticus]|uniref:hypothetical protein n=1 Tax=Maribacter antarcticus TaxID=505250 RepID=UPI0005627475|nr:hypothetical protein [Maribacter antarcticus]
MVTIVDYKTYQRKDGSEFHALVVQGGVEAVKSKESGKTYLTAKTAKVPCTFDIMTCESLKGTTLPGGIKKVNVEPYEYAIPSTGEIINLTHRNEYIGEEESIVNNNVIDKALAV